MKKISTTHYCYVLATLIFTMTAWNSQLLQTTCSDHSVVAEKVVQAAEGVSQEKRKSLDKGSKSFFTFKGEEEEIAAILAELQEIAETATQAATVGGESQAAVQAAVKAVVQAILLASLQAAAEKVVQAAAEAVVQVALQAAARESQEAVSLFLLLRGKKRR